MQRFLDTHQHTIRDFFVKNGQELHYDKNQIIVRADDPQPWTYFLANGIVNVSSLLEDGVKRPLGYVTYGGTFAQTKSFYGDTSGQLNFAATTGCTIFRVHRDVFLQQLNTDFAFAKEYVQIINWYRIIMTDNILYLGEHKLTSRCIRWLLYMAKYYSEPEGDGCRVVIPLTQDVIADYLHSSRESVSKALRDLIRAGHISIEKKYISIRDVSALAALLKK